MKSLMILGGLVGFTIGLSVGLVNHGQWPTALWRGSVAALIGGLLLRWWGRMWVNGLRESHQQQLAKAGESGKETQKL